MLYYCVMLTFELLLGVYLLGIVIPREKKQARKDRMTLRERSFYLALKKEGYDFSVAEFKEVLKDYDSGK